MHKNQEFIYRAKTIEGEFIEGILIEDKIFNGDLKETVEEPQVLKVFTKISQDMS